MDKYKYTIKTPNRTDPGAAAGAAKKIPPKRFIADVRTMFKTKKQPEDDDVFFISLAAMTPGDIALNEAAKSVKKPQADILRYFMLLVSLGVFVYAGYQIVDRLYAYVSAAQERNYIQSLMWDYDDDLPGAEVLKRTRANVPIQDILVLQRQTGTRIIEAETSDGVRDIDRGRSNIQRVSVRNKDFYCWIKMYHTKPTNIDYPVVQTTNDEYYLKHSFDGKYNPSGAIYVAAANSREIMENRNTVIYGHNMLDGSMFQPIIDFGRYRDYFNNGIIELITEDAIYYYEVFSAREEDPYYWYIQTDFPDDETWVEFLYDMQARSNFTKNLVFNEENRIVTLSTCINDTRRNWRFTVQGVLIDVLVETNQ